MPCFIHDGVVHSTSTPQSPAYSLAAAPGAGPLCAWVMTSMASVVGELTRDVDPARGLYVCQRRALALLLSAAASVIAAVIGCGGLGSVGDMDTALSGRCMSWASGVLDAASSHTTEAGV